jgi:hypothetical protein
MLLMQPLLPLTQSTEMSESEKIVEFSSLNDEIKELSRIGIEPILDLEHGWESPNADSEVWLRHRDAGAVDIEKWSEDVVDGWVVLQHSYPVPSEWHGQLAAAGIECHSFLPPSAFHCKVNSVNLDELERLDVQSLMKIDPTDRIHLSLTQLLLGERSQPFATKDLVTVNVVLSGNDWPDLPHKQGSMVIQHSHDGRFATATANTLGISLLASQPEIEWMEPRPVFSILNDVAQHWMAIDQISDSSNISALNSNYAAVDGSGIIVTVADTGIDNGINNSNMHDDFRDHITGILSVPVPESVQYWAQQYNGGWDDGASDLDSGHGTHVAGSVLGDGSASNGDIIGAAPEAHLLFQATEQYVDFNSNAGVADGFGLWAIPDDIRDLFDLAAENGSLVHTNSWGSGVDGEYTTSAMQADDAARTHANMSILFAGANEGEDANNDGEVDLDSLGSPGTAKNVITVGATENDRYTFCEGDGTCWYTGTWGSSYGSPISSDRTGGDVEGMAAFSSRGPTDDSRLKPDISAPGTWILSTKSRSTSDTGWNAYDTDYTYMGGTSMATPLTAGAVALLIEHLKENVGHDNPSSALIKAIMASGADDMAGQYSSSTNGAGETAPNNHEGWGRVNMGTSANVSFVDGEALSTNEQLSFKFNVSAGTPDLAIMLAWTDPASTTAASVNLVNDLDLAIMSPSGTWTNLSNDRDNLRGIEFSNPATGTWEIRVLGTNVPTGPQEFSLVLSRNFTLINGSTDADMDGVDNEEDDCPAIPGTSTVDRKGCPDTDGDGYSNPDANWGVSDGADEFVNDATQWIDADDDGYGDNQAGVEPDSCTSQAGWSNKDRYGCLDSDNDGWSNPDTNWLTTDGADACPMTSGTSNQDRNGCDDSDGDGYSDEDANWDISQGADAFVNDPTQWADSDGDGYGDNASGTNPDIFPLDSSQWVDTDGDGYGDNASGTNPDIFPLDSSQWADSDGDGYGDEPLGTNPDGCPNVFGNSTIDLFGCLDTDGDGYSDLNDDFPNDPSRNSDLDSDGYADNEDDCPTVNGNSTQDQTGCLDSDGDGWSDVGDLFPNESSQWADSDGDGYGDNSSGYQADSCPQQVGTSNQNSTFGCLDSDLDGWADSDDAFPTITSQWLDSDLDGYGDNPSGDSPDACPDVSGTSDQQSVLGCPDSDGDGWADSIDDLPDDGTQQSDIDGDGFGDDLSGFQPDACVNIAGNSTNDRFGCPDRDGDGMSDDNDDFPDDPLRAGDADADGLDDALEDDCSNTYGTSTHDRRGCPDSDGDGYSDPDQSWMVSMGADAFPLIPSQWEDFDDDGYGDNASGLEPDSCIQVQGDSTEDRYGCPDSDGDGWSNPDTLWNAGNGADAFPDEASQWADSDGDGYGDEALGIMADQCPNVSGGSTVDRLGCIDSDNDGWSDADSTWSTDDGADIWPQDATQSTDSDGDGFGDNLSGNNADDCPNEAGTSMQASKGCVDGDGDGWADEDDAFPEIPSQWQDSDGDGWGDNQSSGASRVDNFPDDPDSWSVTVSLNCIQSDLILDMMNQKELVVTCTVSNEADISVVAILIWDMPIGMDSDDNRQIIQFTSAGTPGAVKEIVLRATGTKVGEYLSVIKTEAPGAEQAMDSVTIELQVVDTTPEDDAEAESASNSKGDFNLAGIEMSTENLRLFIAGAVLVVVGLGIVIRVIKPKTRKQRKGAQQFTSGGLFAEGMPPPPEPPSWQQESSWKY